MEKRKARKGKDLVVLFWRGDEDDFAILQKVKDEAPEIYIYSLKEMMSREFNSYLNALIGLEFLNFKEFAEADTDGEENGVCLYNP